MSLERALELAERGRGTTYPNPVVGAVVVRDGEVVGEGWHERKGEPHAEVIALQAAGERARGATLFVTMEPCAHHGTTPPCTDAVLAAGVAKVVAGSLDPNPEAGGGLEVLRRAGVEVEDADSFEARAQNEAWRTWIEAKRPFVVLKLGLTLDGRVAIPGARWITGEQSRHRVHELRAHVDAVAVGMGTARTDDPQLTARGVDAVQAAAAARVRARTDAAGRAARAANRRARRRARRSRAGGCSVAVARRRSHARRVVPARGPVDKVMLFVAPTIGRNGPAFAPELLAPVQLRRFTAERVGDDLLLGGYVHEP